MQRSTLSIDGRTYVLAQGAHTSVLRASVEEAVAAGGRFVDFTVVGNIAVSVLVSPGVAISLTTREVPSDDRDTGNVSDPYEDELIWDIADLY